MRTDALTSHPNPILKALSSPKSLLTLVLGAAAWHYGDLGATKDVSAAVQKVDQRVTDQGNAIDVQRSAIQRKVDKETYDRDVRDLRDRQVHLQDSVDDIKRILIERH